MLNAEINGRIDHYREAHLAGKITKHELQGFMAALLKEVLKNEDLQKLRHEYRPYDELAEFDEGFLEYGKRWANPYDDDQGVKAQAWDRGLECAMRWRRAIALQRLERDAIREVIDSLRD